MNGKIIFAALFAALFLLTGGAGAYSGGDGSVDNPYQISDSGDLIHLSTDSANWGQHFILTANIDLPDGGSPTSTIGNSGYGTEFTGSFDGQGHTIRNFEMNTSGDYVGLFGNIEGGEIKNLGIEAGESGVRGRQYVGVLVGFNYKGSITNCYATGNATAAKDDAGGLVGTHCEGSITNCYATGDASADSYAGGLVGVNEMGTITNCYATGNASATDRYAGGLAGYLYISSLTNCYATGDASADSYAGGLVGQINDGSITNCYRYADYGDDQVTHVSDILKFKDYGFITGTTVTNGLNWSTDIISTETDYSRVWYVPSSKTEYPTFQWGISGTIQVNSIPDGAAVSFNGVTTEKNTNHIFNNQHAGVYHVTVERVGYTSSPEYQEVTLARDETKTVVFTLTENKYSGGKGTADSPYEISDMGDLINLSTDSVNWGKYFIQTADINLPDGESPTSTIGYSGTKFTGSFDGQGHTIRNFEMNKPGDEYVGLFGYIEGGNIKNLGIEAGLRGVSGHSSVGVLAGCNYDGSITNCSATGDATADNYAGGLVGVNVGHITDCYATGDSTAAVRYAGGLVGENVGGSITNCYATGNAPAVVSYAGGLVGGNVGGSITNCYATGYARATDGSAGGLVGYTDGGTITNGYRHDTHGNNEGTLDTDLSDFMNYSFLTGTTETKGLNWSTDIISTEPDSSRVWYVPSSKTEYPTFQWALSNSDIIPINITPSSKPVPSFTATPVSGYAPLPVTFTDTSTGVPQSWNWSFGDGTVSDVQHPVHIYERAGAYSVSLTATNVYGNVTCEKEQFITANYHHVSDGDDSPTPYIKSTPVPTTVTPTPEATITTTPGTPLAKSTEFTGSAELPVGPDGAVERQVTIWAEDLSGYLTIDAGVVARDASGRPVGTISIVAVPVTIIPSSGEIGAIEYPRALYSFNCTPTGVTFSPPITLTFTLSEDEWEKYGDKTEVGWFNSTSEEWEIIAGVTDATKRTITISVSHFSMYALFTDDVPEVPLPDMTKIPAGSSAGSSLWVWGGLLIVVGILGGILFSRRRKEE